MITSLEQLDLNERYTYADYLSWQLKERVELIKGRIFRMSPAPSRIHQQVSGHLFGELYKQLKGYKCQLYSAPFDVRLNSPNQEGDQIQTVVQPDICIICDPAKLDDKGAIGAPDFICEILSASTSKKDLQDKKMLYAYNGVPEYWIIHPSEGTVIKYILDKEHDDYRYQGIFTSGDTLSLDSLPGMYVELEQLFHDGLEPKQP